MCVHTINRLSFLKHLSVVVTNLLDGRLAFSNMEVLPWLTYLTVVFPIRCWGQLYTCRFKFTDNWHFPNAVHLNRMVNDQVSLWKHMFPHRLVRAEPMTQDHQLLPRAHYAHIVSRQEHRCLLSHTTLRRSVPELVIECVDVIMKHTHIYSPNSILIRLHHMSSTISSYVVH